MSTLRYSDIDPNVIELLARQLESPLEKLIEDKIQRRQQWGPTFKQEDIAELQMTDADFVVPAPEYGKRVLRMAGSLTVQRVLRLPPIPSAWWIIHNRTSEALHCLTDPSGTTGPVIPPDQVGAVYTDGLGVWQFACCGGETVPGGEEMPPGGTGTEIQYRLNATTFGGIAGSSVSGANSVFAGTVTLDNVNQKIFMSALTANDASIVLTEYQTPASGATTPPFLAFERARGSSVSAGDIGNADVVGAVVFRGRLSGAFTQLGYVRSYYSSSLGGLIEMGAMSGAQARIVIAEAPTLNSVTMIAAGGTHFMQVQQDGLRLSGGAIGTIFYQDGTPDLIYTPLAIGATGDVLKVVAGKPAWGPLAGASFPRLDQVLDPDMATPPTNRVKNFLMADHSLVFSFTATQAEECVVIVSTTPVTPGAAGSLLLLQAQGATTEKNPLRIEARGVFVMSVTSTGTVAIGSETVTSAHKVGISNPTSTIGSLVIQESIPASGGARNAFTMSLGDNSTVSHSGYYGINISYSKNAVQASTPAFLLHINPSSISESMTALTSISLRGPGVLPGKTITTWTGINIANVALGGTVTNKYAIVIESGAGFVGFGTSAPAAQLHVVGSVQLDVGGDVLGDIYYRAASGLLASLHNSGSAWDGRVLTLSSGIPVWATPSGGPGSTTPGGDPGNLQYNIADTSFEGITSTSFGLDSDSLPTLGMGPNQLTVGTKDSTSYIGLRAINTQSTRLLIQAGHVTQTPTLLFQRSEASLGNLATGKSAGDIQWEARVGGAWVVQGLLKTSYSATLGGTVWLSSGTGGSRIEIFQKTVRVTAIDGSPYWQYEYTSTGPKWTNSSATHGLQGAIYYVSSTIAQTALPISTTAGQVLTTTEISAGVWEPRWANPSGGPGGGITSTGGNTNSIQYRSGAGTTTLGGVNTTIGVLIASATNGLASFATTLPTTRFWFSPGTTAGLNVGQGFTQPSSLNSTDGDIFYDSSIGKFRVRENGVWQDMRGGGAGSPGGATNSVQYNTGSGFGGIPVGSGTLVYDATLGGSSYFSQGFPQVRMQFTPGTATAGLNVGQKLTDPPAGSAVIGDVYYNATTHKFRGFVNTAWADLGGIGGTVSPPVSLDYTATVNQPTLYVNHLQAGPASTVANVYGEIHWFRHLHSGTVSDGRRGFTFAWDHQASGTGGTSAGGDIIIEIYGTNAPSMGLGSYTLTGFAIGTFFNSQVGSWTALRIKEVNANLKRAIVVDLNAGDVVIGGALATTATQGFLFIPTCPGVPTGSPANFPAGTCALCYNSATNQLYANDGGGWVLV